MAFDYDLFVIGGGSGGVRAARVAAGETGAKVALAEEDRYGGTCVIRGCVPKKLMVYASGYSKAMAEAASYGWSVTPGRFDWLVFRGKLETELDRLEGIYRKLLKNSGVETFDARAAVNGPNSVTLSDGRSFTAKTILVATGGRPVKPDVPGAEYGITSNDIFHLDQMPKSILIIGGGYIACEFAGVMNGLGVDTTQWYRGDQVLRGFDEEARTMIADGMRDKGVNLQTGLNIAEMRKVDGGVWVKSTAGDEAVFDQVLFATGRVPNSDNLGLEDLGIALGRNGAVQVDDYSQTAVPSIYAIGDVTDRVNLTPVAIREGMAFVETALKGNPTPVDHDLIPTAVFTQPEYGTVGLTEEEAAAQEPIAVYAAAFRPMNTSFIDKPDRVLMKLVVSKATRKVLGVHIVGDAAGEMIQMVGIAVKMGATKEDFDRVCAVHPTVAEELVTLKTPVRET
ncbi:MAG: glutathione-disulfide reductase [Planktomarina sp.]